MKKEYNFANSKPNPYINKLHKQISIRILFKIEFIFSVFLGFIND